MSGLSIDEKLAELEREKQKLMEEKKRVVVVPTPSIDLNSLNKIQQSMETKRAADAALEAERMEKQRASEFAMKLQLEAERRQVDLEMPERLKLAEPIWKWIVDFRTTDLCKHLFTKNEYVEIYRRWPESWTHYDIKKATEAIYVRRFAKWAGTVTDAVCESAGDLAKRHSIQELTHMLHTFRPGGEVYDDMVQFMKDKQCYSCRLCGSLSTVPPFIPVRVHMFLHRTDLRQQQRLRENENYPCR